MWGDEMKEKTATFIGHRNCYAIDKEKLTEEIRKLAEQGISEFLCGGMGDFDGLCAHIVRNLKKEYKNIKVCLVIPYLTFSSADFEYYDEIIYPEGFEKYFFKSAIIKRNHFLVDNSSVSICYVNRSSGGAARTFEYAKKQGIKMINLGTM